MISIFHIKCNSCVSNRISKAKGSESDRLQISSYVRRRKNAQTIICGNRWWRFHYPRLALSLALPICPRGLSSFCLFALPFFIRYVFSSAIYVSRNMVSNFVIPQLPSLIAANFHLSFGQFNYSTRCALKSFSAFLNCQPSLNFNPALYSSQTKNHAVLSLCVCFFSAQELIYNEILLRKL